jgi:hypothetical protein
MSEVRGSKPGQREEAAGQAAEVEEGAGNVHMHALTR